MSGSDTTAKDAIRAGALDDSLGTWSDPVVEWMARSGIPLTRRNYLELSYAKGECPDPLPAELEAMLPPELVDE